MRSCHALSCPLLIAWRVRRRPARLDRDVLDPYLRIQDALVDDRIDTIKADAALVARKPPGLGDDGKAIAAAAADAGRGRILGDARLAFGKLSDAVIAYSEQTKANPGDDVVARTARW